MGYYRPRSKEPLLGYFRNVSRSLPTALSWDACGSESSWQQVAQRYRWASFKVAGPSVLFNLSGQLGIDKGKVLPESHDSAGRSLGADWGFSFLCWIRGKCLFVTVNPSVKHA